MEAAENDSQGVPQLGRIERALSNPRFQRAFGMWASILGLIFVVFAIAGDILAPRHPGSVLLSWSTVEGSMLLLAVTMGFILALTAGLLGA